MTAKQTANAIWSEVLESMPAHLQSRFALVEARRRLIGFDDGEMGLVELDRLAVAAFGPEQIKAVSEVQTVPEPPKPGAPTEDIEEVVRLAVCKGFEGTIYDTAEFIAGVEARALEEAENVIRSNTRLNWFQRRRLRAIARTEAAAQLKLLSQRP